MIINININIIIVVVAALIQDYKSILTHSATHTQYNSLFT